MLLRLLVVLLLGLLRLLVILLLVLLLRLLRLLGLRGLLGLLLTGACLRAAAWACRGFARHLRSAPRTVDHCHNFFLHFVAMTNLYWKVYRRRALQSI